MSGLELNKISAAILLAGVIAMSAAIISEIVYHGGGHHEEEKRGYFVEVEEATEGGGKEEVKLSIPELLALASVDKGKKIAKKCAACHTFEKGGANKVGPNLWNMINASKAGVGGFAYSQALMDSEGNWDYESLFAFLEKPSAYVKGTKMAFAGLKKPEQRAHMIAYMRSMSDNPAALPEVPVKPAEDTPAAESAEEASSEE